MSSIKDLYDIKELKEKNISREKEAEAEKEEPAINEAAAAILASKGNKDKKVSFRVQTSTYAKFSEINTKLGATNGSVLNILLSNYVKEHKDLLE